MFQNNAGRQEPPAKTLTDPEQTWSFTIPGATIE
jgi:hypothetical protein